MQQEGATSAKAGRLTRARRSFDRSKKKFRSFFERKKASVEVFVEPSGMSWWLGKVCRGGMIHHGGSQGRDVGSPSREQLEVW